MHTPSQHKVWLLLCLTLLVSACDNHSNRGNSIPTNQAPTFSSPAAASVAEGSTATGYTATASDPDVGDTLTYSISGGADAA